MKRIAFIGCGNMGEALLRGLISKGIFTKNLVTISDKKTERQAYLKKQFGVKIASSNVRAVSESDIVIIAVKPQDVAALLNDLNTEIMDRLVISIAAGISIDYISSRTSAKRIVRAMPNMPAVSGLGVTAISYKKGTPASDISTADKIFRSVGDVLHIDESKMDAVTALSGSGPAYFFLFIQSMIKSAVSLGIRPDIAKALVTQTAFGATALLCYTKKDPSILIGQVASKGGTTEAALKVFNKHGFEKTVKAAIIAAAKRSKALSIKI